MKCYVGIDLGSTTTKAIILDEAKEQIGAGITNSRSNYDVACRIAKDEAFFNARFFILKQKAEQRGMMKGEAIGFLDYLNRLFRHQSHLEQLRILQELSFERTRDLRFHAVRTELERVLEKIFGKMVENAEADLKEQTNRKSDFFRDIAGSQFQSLADTYSKGAGVSFDQLMSVFDHVIFQVENRPQKDRYSENVNELLSRLRKEAGTHREYELWIPLIEETSALQFEEAGMVGTGYGRQRLPFPKDHIQSEILCHGYGAHRMFESTATVLDIGGQDTKAIQLDSSGIVTSFQMNDRCAAGCGRYLGYIADEMNMGLHELGPLAMKSERTTKINSTCTVFAGAELRDRLALGQRREDILAGLHRAMILRAMSLLARSGGIKSEFTFTGGVAKNPAAVRALAELVEENYGKMKINIHPDSIYTGALGAALFAWEKAHGVVSGRES